jgi:C-terminal processing protease CtpA/Prc
MRLIRQFLLVFLLAWPAMAAEEPVAAVVKRLGAEKFAERQAAERELVQLAERGHEAVLRVCVAGYRQSTDPEVRLRLKSAMEQIVEKHLFGAPRGFLGIQINNVFIGEGGQVIINGVQVPARAIWVGNVVENSGAAKAGLQPNDIITAVNGEQWPDGPTGFTRFIQAKKPGSVVKLTVLRGNETKEVAATLGDLPEAERERLGLRQREFFEQWWRENIGEELPVE